MVTLISIAGEKHGVNQAQVFISCFATFFISLKFGKAKEDK